VPDFTLMLGMGHCRDTRQRARMVAIVHLMSPVYTRSRNLVLDMAINWLMEA
jgi:hypothetical protein